MRNPSPTVQVATKVVYAAFELLRESGGQMKVRDILAGVAKRVPSTTGRRSGTSPATSADRRFSSSTRATASRLGSCARSRARGF